MRFYANKVVFFAISHLVLPFCHPFGNWWQVVRTEGEAGENCMDRTLPLAPLSVVQEALLSLAVPLMLRGYTPLQGLLLFKYCTPFANVR